jgi:hypothetical protein
MAVELVTGTFDGRVGETFVATPTYSGEPLEVELTSCVESPHARPDHPAFSLFFRASDREHREQQIFTLRHAELGEFDLFLVPVGPRDYEAVIN